MPAPLAHQVSFDEIGEPLRELTFVVVDLETTGGSPREAAITEIGAVKVRGGQVIGEFQTLVDPEVAIPPFIAVLTGITDDMVGAAPRLATALPAFLDWAGGAVLVAHNAPFDLGFLRSGCEQLDLAWPEVRSLDTARLARRVLTRDDAPDCKLATLACLFRATTTPCHRALADARATVDVLHGLLERLGPLGVQTWEELRTFSGLASAGQRRKRHLADGLPDGPGVYLFRDGAGRVLYVGRSRALRHRVRQYFTASEPRTRIAEMVGIAERVDAISCAHDLEAQVREVRLIAETKPRYNRRSKFPERAVWLVLTREAFPRLSLVHRRPSHAEVHLGPFPSAKVAQQAITAVYDVIPLRQCSLRLRPGRVVSACALADMGRCPSPCNGRIDEPAYARLVRSVQELFAAELGPLVAAADRRLSALAAQQRFEEAASVRDRAAALARAAERLQRLAALAGITELVAARPDDARGGWELAVVRHGRLAGAASAPRGAALAPAIRAVLSAAEQVAPPDTVLGAALAEETDLIERWLTRGDVRLVTISDVWTSSRRAAGHSVDWLERLDAARVTASPFDDRRGLRPLSRPARAVG
jgi:DNA polymerase-3 subunit epsilon